VQKFDEVLALIEAARRRAYQAINTELVDLYWELGQYISKKIASAEWGDGVVDELAATIARQYPGMRGYTRRNLFRMRQFYDTYQGNKKVSDEASRRAGVLHARSHQRAVDQARTRAPDPHGICTSQPRAGEESVTGGDTNAPDGHR
jgi:hypothetical protein